MSSTKVDQDKKELSLEAKRKQKILEKGNTSAAQRFKSFLSSKNRVQDPDNKNAASRLLKIVLCEQWGIVALSIPLSFLGSMQDFTSSAFIGVTIDAMQAGDWDTFNEKLIQWVVIIVVGSFFAGLRDFVYGVSSEKIGRSLRERFFMTILKKDTSFFDERKVGDMLSRLTSDTQIVQMGLTTNVAMFLKSVFTMIAIYIILFFYSWKYALISIAFLIPLIIVMPLFQRIQSFTQWQYQDEKAEMSSVANETLGNIKTVKAFAGEDVAIENFNLSNFVVTNIGYNMGSYMAIMFIFFTFFFQGAFCGMAYVTGFGVKNGELTPGEVTAFLLYNWQILFNIMGLNSNLQGVAKVQGSFYEIACLVTQKNKQEGYYDPKPVTEEMKTAQMGEVDIVNVDFNYPTKPDVPVLKCINIDVPNCTTVALVGHSGCGKSSIIALIERFYDPVSGSALFNKQDIKEIDTKWYHQQKLAIVQQEPNLFSTSIRENILYGFDASELSEEEVETRLQESLKQASCGFLDDKALFPEGLMTMVGERGSRLSGGQKQRVAIARALVRRPRVLLLDEATSALDAESEHQVQAALDTLLEQKSFTVVVIAHRLSTIVNANKIIVMKKGEIQEIGTHQELLENDGAYKKLVSRQLINSQLGENIKK